MRINTNIMALNAYNNLENTSANLNSSLAKLSSGYRINKAADDASGLVISENLKSQVSGLQQATRNAQDGISVVQTAEGALSAVQAMLQRIRDLVIQSANTGASDSTARQAAQNEIIQLRNEIDRVANTTSFGNAHLLDGSFGAQSARASGQTTVAATGLTVGNTATATFTLVVDSGAAASLSVTVTIVSGTYATAASFQTELQKDIDAALTGNAGFTGAVTAHVRDLGSGVWSVELVRNSADQTAKLTTTAVGASVPALTAASAATTTTGGGVFQVGANVTANDQIGLSIADERITGGTDGAFTALASIDVTNTANYRERATADRRRAGRGVEQPGRPRCGPEPLHVDDLEPSGERREPHRVGVADRRHRHVARDGHLHQEPDPPAGRYRHARPGEQRAPDNSEAPPVVV